MITEFNRDVDKLSNDLTNQSRNSIMYLISFFGLRIYIDLIMYRTTKEANRRRTLVDAIIQTKEEIENTMRESFNASG
jgi:hypothetical protein